MAIAVKANARSVDVMVAARNARKTIARAIHSALAQPETARVIVVDDASSDDTAAVARSCEDGEGRLVILRQTTNLGPAGARNRALAHATAAWVTILDADDAMMPGRLGALLAYGDRADLIADDLLVVIEDEEAAPRPMFTPPVAFPQPIDAVTFIRANITHGRRDRQDLGYIKPVMRRGFIEKHALRYNEAMRLGEDYELYVRALLHGAKLLLTPAAGYLYTIGSHSIAANHGMAELRALRDCDGPLIALAGRATPEARALAAHRAGVDAKLQWLLLIAAVKARRPSAAIATLRSPSTAWYIARQLLAEASRRAGRR